jgi:hypothetical protein
MGLAEFRSERKHSGKRSKKSFNACVSVEYNERQEVPSASSRARKKPKKKVSKICYGVIEQMFLSECGVDGTPPSVVIQGRWYAVEGADEITGLPLVAYKKNWDEDCRVSFLNQVYPVNLTMWPADPFKKSIVNGKAKYTVRKPGWKDESFHFHPIYKHNKPKMNN